MTIDKNDNKMETVVILRRFFVAVIICCGMWTAAYCAESMDEDGTFAWGIRAQWAEEALSGYSSYEVFVADRSDSQVRLLFSADYNVKEFKVLAISMTDVDAEGKGIFTQKDLYSTAKLTPEHPLVLEMTFWGDLPTYGISYVDQNGTTRRFSIGMSGKDGSIQLMEF